jgi:hypothetical protein
VLEFVPHTLRKLIKEPNEGARLNLFQKVAQGIIEGIIYLHDASLIHR